MKKYKSPTLIMNIDEQIDSIMTSGGGLDDGWESDIFFSNGEMPIGEDVLE